LHAPRLLKRRGIELRTLSISVATTLFALACGFVLLYQFTVDGRTVQLVEMARSQARLMEAVAKFDAFFLSSEVQGVARSATLSQLRESHRRYSGFGETGEIVLAERFGDEIVFLLPTRKRGFRLPPPLNLETAGAAPMKLALAGESGVVTGVDHSETLVLAAYEWLPFLEMGLVCKIDMAEIRAPFYRAALITVGFAAALILVGAFLTSRMISPLVGRIEAATAGLHHELRVARSLVEQADREHEFALIGESPALRGLTEAMELHARSPDPLLLTGSPGAGQQAVARGIHRLSDRSERTFIYFDCSRITMEDTTCLFDTRSRSGTATACAVLAHEGTLYVENITELPVDSQKRMLEYVVESARGRGRGEIPQPDVRLIAYAAQGVEEAVLAGQFNGDLAKALGFERLAVPSLAERRGDVPALAERIIADRARARGRVFEGIEPESLERMVAYAWPGNVTELSSVIERALAVSRGAWIEVREDLLDHTTQLGQYRLERLLGSGGMADVWLARHDLLARPVALKLIRKGLLAADVGTRDIFQRRFEQEAQFTARLRSPHTVELYDFGTGEAGELYYVMELLEGKDLGEIVKDSGPMEPERVVFLIAQACLSLTEAHSEGLVHRDIKPGNLFACRLGSQYDFLKVLDFGIVKAIDKPGDEPQMTSTGVLPGTPYYLAPEVLREEPANAKADIYALGCSAYFLLTGSPVFPMPSATAVFQAHLGQKPSKPSESARHTVPPELDHVVLACLEKDPTQRPTALELREMLLQIPLEHPWTEARAARWWQARPSSSSDVPTDPFGEPQS
jgi:serine/threonine protein kinase